MVDSDKSDNDESLKTGKRSHEYNSEDEKVENPSKRPRSKSPEHQENVGSKKDLIVQVTNGSTLPSSEEKSDKVNVDNEHKNGKATATDDDTSISIEEEDLPELKMEVSETDEKSREDAEKLNKSEKMEINKESAEVEEEEEDSSLLDKSKDSEVVDGLELSVECASDKEASSSESDKAEDSKPRPKTIIVKAKPNDSELEVGSSEAEKSGNHDKEDDVDGDSKNKKRKRVGKRKQLTKVSSSRSEDSAESNSEDEDYSPRAKKNLKKNVGAKKATPQKSKPKKEREKKKKPAADSENEKSESEDEEMSLAARAKKMVVKSKDRASEKDKSDSASSDETDGLVDNDEKNKKNGKRKSRSSKDPGDDDKIKRLKKYVTTAGIHVRYADLWSGCKSNKERTERLKKLLEDNGIEGRPTIEKCKRIKKINATKKEIAELDTSNIISEGRVTRARRTEANKALGTPPKYRETRNIFKRIQPVCDSDTE